MLGRWSELDNTRRYLYVIAANLVKDHWRKSRREQRAVSKMAAAYAGASTWYPADGADLGALIELIEPAGQLTEPARRIRLIAAKQADRRDPAVEGVGSPRFGSPVRSSERAARGGGRGTSGQPGR